MMDSGTVAVADFPAAVGLCPEHREEFYLPLDEGELRAGPRCPEPGCDCGLVVYCMAAAGSDEWLRAAGVKP